MRTSSIPTLGYIRHVRIVGCNREVTITYGLNRSIQFIEPNTNPKRNIKEPCMFTFTKNKNHPGRIL